MLNNNIDRLGLRKAEIEEMEWAYQLFKSGQQQYIAETWGWNELFQRHSFMANLPPSSFVIISLDGEDIGGYCLNNKGSYLQLEMLLLAPEHQGRGLGRSIMQYLLTQASEQGLPIHLSVLKNNPAHQFYHKLGFSVHEQDNFSYCMSNSHLEQPE